MEQKLNRIEKQIYQIKQDLQAIGEMRPGTLTCQFARQNNKKYPYYQLSYTYQMKSRTDYVRKEFVADLRQQTKNYRKFKKLVNRWIELALQYSKLKLAIAIKKT